MKLKFEYLILLVIFLLPLYFLKDAIFADVIGYGELGPFLTKIDIIVQNILNWGSIPVWNSITMSGYPILSAGHMNLLAHLPPALTYFLIPNTSSVYKLFIYLYFVLVGLISFVCMNKILKDKQISFLLSLIYSYSPIISCVFFYLGYTEFILAFAIIPAVIFFYINQYRSNKPKLSFILSLISLLFVHVQYAIYLLIILAFHFLFYSLFNKKLNFSVVFSILISLLIFSPLALLHIQSNDFMVLSLFNPDHSLAWSAHPLNSISLLFEGNNLPSGESYLAGISSFFLLIPFSFALLSIFIPKKGKKNLAWLFAIIFGIFLASGFITQPMILDVLSRHLDMLYSFRTPHRVVSLIEFPILFLCGLYIKYISKNKWIKGFLLFLLILYLYFITLPALFVITPYNIPKEYYDRINTIPENTNILWHPYDSFVKAIYGHLMLNRNLKSVYSGETIFEQTELTNHILRTAESHASDSKKYLRDISQFFSLSYLFSSNINLPIMLLGSDVNYTISAPIFDMLRIKKGVYYKTHYPSVYFVPQSKLWAEISSTYTLGYPFLTDQPHVSLFNPYTGILNINYWNFSNILLHELTLDDLILWYVLDKNATLIEAEKYAKMWNQWQPLAYFQPAYHARCANSKGGGDLTISFDIYKKKKYCLFARIYYTDGWRGNLTMEFNKTILNVTPHGMEGFKWVNIGCYTLTPGKYELIIRSKNGPNDIDNIAVIPEDILNKELVIFKEKIEKLKDKMILSSNNEDLIPLEPKKANDTFSSSNCKLLNWAKYYPDDTPFFKRADWYGKNLTVLWDKNYYIEYLFSFDTPSEAYITLCAGDDKPGPVIFSVLLSDNNIVWNEKGRLIFDKDNDWFSCKQLYFGVLDKGNYSIKIRFINPWYAENPDNKPPREGMPNPQSTEGKKLYVGSMWNRIGVIENLSLCSLPVNTTHRKEFSMIKCEQYDTASYHCILSTNESGLIALDQSYFPDWKCTCNGMHVLVNGAFNGWLVPAQASIFDLFYSPI